MQENKLRNSVLQDSTKVNIIRYSTPSKNSDFKPSENSRRLLNLREDLKNQQLTESINNQSNLRIQCANNQPLSCIAQCSQSFTNHFMTPRQKKQMQCENQEINLFDNKQFLESFNSKNIKYLSRKFDDFKIQSPNFCSYEAFSIKKQTNQRQMSNKNKNISNVKNCAKKAKKSHDLLSIRNKKKSLLAEYQDILSPVAFISQQVNKKSNRKDNQQNKLMMKQQQSNGDICFRQLKLFQTNQNNEEQPWFQRNNRKQQNQLQVQPERIQNKIQESNILFQNDYSEQPFQNQSFENPFCSQKRYFSSQALILLNDQQEFKMCKIPSLENQRLNLRRRNSIIELNQQKQNKLIIEKLQNEHLQQVKDQNKIKQMDAFLNEIVQDFKKIVSELKKTTIMQYNHRDGEQDEGKYDFSGKMSKGRKRVKTQNDE